MKTLKQFLMPIYEKELLSKGYDSIVGIDEAGRGPWAGPVSIAGYIYTKDKKFVNGIHDSKKLTKQQRKEKFWELEKNYSYFHELISSEKIDEFGIGNVIEKSISSIIAQSYEILKGKKIIFLIDGYFKTKFDAEYELIKKGDSKIYSIAAASIIAKYKRDLVMQELAKKYPEYGFDKHVGYGTKQHLLMLEKYGPCPIHRFSYKPVAKLSSS